MILKMEDLWVTVPSESTSRFSPISFQKDNGAETALLKGIDLELHEKEIVALAGESGSGKSTLCKCLAGILPANATIKQKSFFKICGLQISMVFQNPQSSLNPTMAVGEQIAEAILLKSLAEADRSGICLPFSSEKRRMKAQARERALGLLREVGIHDADRRYGQRPYQFSGGMQQRAAIAVALAADPQLILADEPTTALDQKTQEGILQLLKELQEKLDFSILFVTHDLSLVERLASRTAVMKDGSIVEFRSTEDLFRQPCHEYTKQLIRYLDYRKGRGHTHGKIHFHNGLVHAHESTGPHYHRDEGGSARSGHPESSGGNTGIGHSDSSDSMPVPPRTDDSSEKPGRTHAGSNKSLLSISGLNACYGNGKQKRQVLRDFYMAVERGEIVGLVGPSGCGKSTLAKCIMDLHRPDSGKLEYGGVNKQIIFQDSSAAFNPRMTIGEIIAEPMILKRLGTEKTLREDIFKLMEQVELPAEFYHRYPYTLSGGERQRAAIARAISTNPDLIVADEPVSSLDISIQAQIVHLFKELQERLGLSILFIAHDIPMVRHISDRILTMEALQK